MGVMSGKILNQEFVVMDVYPLPVEGTETRVNALSQAYEYMVQYLESLKAVGRPENIVGWYHSHPGYGCWLSGIDVGTQEQNQTYQDPFLAIVVDPNRTISAGKVDIGAFRTYPAGYVPSDNPADSHQSIPLSKMEDFGVHADKYYPLEISYFKSSLDSRILELLWNKYWVSTLSQSSLLTNHAYTTELITDLNEKFTKVRKYSSSRGNLNDNQTLNFLTQGATRPNDSFAPQPTGPSNQLNELLLNSCDIGSEEVHGLITRELKRRLFTQDY